MTIKARNGQRTVRPVLALAVCTLALAVTASAQIAETVNCSDSTSGAYSRIGDALAAALATPGYTPGTQIYINIYGPCQEYVKISGLQNVSLAGMDADLTVLNQPANLFGGTGYWPALEIDNSSWIAVQNLSFVGPGAVSKQSSPLVSVQNSTAISLSNFNVSASVGDGISVYASQIGINGTATIQNNTANGMSIASASTVAVGGYDSAHPVTISNNQQDGIAMSNGGNLSLFWYTTVTENGGTNSTWAGLQMSNSMALLCCGPGPNIDYNVGWGIDAEELSSVIIVGGNSTTPASVSHNTQGGIYDVAGWVGIYNTTNIEYNGDSTQANPLGGIDVLANGALQAYGANIENNYGPGLLVSQSSSADLGLGGSGPTTITANTGSGIYVQVNGSVQFDGAGTTVTGNTPKDLTCAAAGIAAEDNGAPPTIGKMSCGNLFDLPPRKHKKAKN